MTAYALPLRLALDRQALVHNWRWLAQQSGGASCGAAVKADAYGLGAEQVVALLIEAGCRDFFVATWAEALALSSQWDGSDKAAPRFHVLHGVRAADMDLAKRIGASPVLNSVEQVARWRSLGDTRPVSVMIDTGMNRLGLSIAQAQSGLLDGMPVDLVMSHLACADEETPMNGLQCAAFAALRGRFPDSRFSLANSAGIGLGTGFHFDLTRPGLSIYGGVAHASAQGHIRQVVRVEAEILQRRRLNVGDSVGYNATYVADRAVELAIVNLGYADGYWRGFSGHGMARAGEAALPVTGRVSMDLTAINVDAAPTLGEGDWIEMDFDLPHAAHLSGKSQYELLTGLGQRFVRQWR